MGTTKRQGRGLQSPSTSCIHTSNPLVSFSQNAPAHPITKGDSRQNRGFWKRPESRLAPCTPLATGHSSFDSSAAQPGRAWAGGGDVKLRTRTVTSRVGGVGSPRPAVRTCAGAPRRPFPLRGAQPQASLASIYPKAPQPGSSARTLELALSPPVWDPAGNGGHRGGAYG